MNVQAFLRELSKIRASATFLTLKGYRSRSAEIADYSIVFHVSYQHALLRSIRQLKEMNLTSEVDQMARNELISSLERSISKIEQSPTDIKDNGYTYFFDTDGVPIKGVKLHDATNTLHLYGLIAHKRVLMPGSYPVDKRREFTKVKDRLRQQTAIGKFRQFKILPDQLEAVSVENISLLPPNCV